MLCAAKPCVRFEIFPPSVGPNRVLRPNLLLYRGLVMSVMRCLQPNTVTATWSERGFNFSLYIGHIGAGARFKVLSERLEEHG